jgi:hypothetical protein
VTGIPLDQAARRTRLLTYAYAVLLALLPALAPLVALSFIFQLLPERWESLAAGAAAAPAFVAGAGLQTRRAGRRGARHAVYVLTSVYALVVLPLLGLLLDGVADECVRTCGGALRPLAMPEVFGLVPLQVAAALAFFLSVRRPESLAPRLEAALVAGLGVGLVLHAVMAVQFVTIVPIAIFGYTVPVLTPYLSLPFFLHQLLGRLRRRGAELGATGRWGGLLGVPAVLGLHAVVSAALFSSQTGGVDAFLRTCGYPLSQLPVPPPGGCHYLCTIAAQGSPWLVHPYRWGWRRGQLIVVNRQLAVANAFEDLLHERWPRLGRLARRTYDALALPISGWLCRRWAADALYILMKPAEALFVVALLFLDPGDPEARVERVYR